MRLISVDDVGMVEKYAIFKDQHLRRGQHSADADAAARRCCLRLSRAPAPSTGIYPYTTSSNTIGAYAPIGAGIPPSHQPPSAS